MVRGVDAEIPTYNEFVMRELVERSTAQRRFVMLLLAGFALAALLLAGVGIYGTVSQAVAQRTQEIGVRMALGASPGAVLRLVFGEGLRLMAAGLLAGGAAAAGLAWLMRGMLFEVRPLDPVAFLAAAATAGGVRRGGVLPAGAAGDASGPDGGLAAGIAPGVPGVPSQSGGAD